MTNDPDTLVVLTSAATEFEAQALAEALRARGVACEVFATATSALQWEAGYTDPIKVMVRRADLEDAQRVRVALKADSVDINWEDVDTGAPAEPDHERPRRSAMKIVTLLGWSLLAVVGALMAVWLGTIVVHLVFSAVVGVDHGSPLPYYCGLLMGASTLVVLWRVTRKK
jgi:hypothetical protein